MVRHGMALSAALLFTGMLFAAPLPALAQSSCMHCNWAHGKCNMFKPGNETQCAKERDDCIKKCKAEANDKPNPAAQTKADDKKDKK